MRLNLESPFFPSGVLLEKDKVQLHNYEEFGSIEMENFEDKSPYELTNWEVVYAKMMAAEQQAC